MNIKSVVDKFIALRLDLDEKRKIFKAFEKEQKAAMVLLEVEMLKIANETGLDSFSSSTHTAFKTTKTYVRASSDPGALDKLIKFVQDTGDYGLFTSHRNKLHLIELMNEGVNPEDVGCTFESEQVMQVRKR